MSTICRLTYDTQFHDTYIVHTVIKHEEHTNLGPLPYIQLDPHTISLTVSCNNGLESIVPKAISSKGVALGVSLVHGLGDQLCPAMRAGWLASIKNACGEVATAVGSSIGQGTQALVVDD